MNRQDDEQHKEFRVKGTFSDMVQAENQQA
jgi:hypothetical protein